MATTPQMPNVQDDPKFQALSPAAQKLVLAKLGAQPAPQVQAPEPPPTFGQKITTGLLSPQTITKALTFGQGDYNQLRNEQDYIDKDETPGVAAGRRGLAGLGVSTADTLSGFTSPLTLATMGLGAAGRGAGIVGRTLPKVASASRQALAGIGVGLGLSGAKDVAQGAKKGLATIEGSQQALQGGSQVLSAIPSLAMAGRVGAKAAVAAVPQAFATGEPALIQALKPSTADAPALRKAYNVVASDLKTSGVNSVEGLSKFASQQKAGIIQQLEQKAASQPAMTQVNPAPVRDAIKSAVTGLMKLESGQKTMLTPSSQTTPVVVSQLPPKAQGFVEYANRIGSNLTRQPMQLGEAFQIVKDINAEAREFERLTPAERAQASGEGDILAAKIKLKQALQAQIDQKLANYKDLNLKYGSYNELESRAQDRVTELQKQDATSGIGRRALEAGAGAVGMVAGHMIGERAGVMGGELVGSIGAYKAAQAITDAYLKHLANPDRMMARATQGAKATSPTASAIQPGGRAAQALQQTGAAAAGAQQATRTKVGPVTNTPSGDNGDTPLPSAPGLIGSALTPITVTPYGVHYNNAIAQTVANGFGSQYATPEQVMLAMKNGKLSQEAGNRLLQRMKGSKGSSITRPMPPPP